MLDSVLVQKWGELHSTQGSKRLRVLKTKKIITDVRICRPNLLVHTLATAPSQAASRMWCPNHPCHTEQLFQDSRRHHNNLSTILNYENQLHCTHNTVVVWHRQCIFKQNHNDQRIARSRCFAEVQVLWDIVRNRASLLLRFWVSAHENITNYNLMVHFNNELSENREQATHE